jgi:regulator of sigma E protease
MQIWLSILGILLFISLIVIHEWGHFFTARRNGVEVEEFGLGFPPRAWGKKLKSGMVLSLNWLPLGGFVKLKGEHDSDDRPGSLGAASLIAKTKIMLAGVTMNLLAGLALLTLLALIGMPKLLDSRIDGHEQFTVASDTKVTHQEVLANYIQAGSPAEHLGLNTKDSILSLQAGADKRTINSTQSLHDATQAFAGKTVQLTYKHGGQVVTKNATLLSSAEVQPTLKTNDPKGYLGVSPRDLQIRRSTWSAPIVAVGFTKQLVVLTAQGIGHALGGLGSTIAGAVTGNHAARENGQTAASSQVGGPVAIATVLWGSGSLGINFVLMIIAILSLTLAFMNVLPIPALDGGRLFLTLFWRGILRRPLSRATEERITATGMAVLLTLIVLITIVDVNRFL